MRRLLRGLGAVLARLLVLGGVAALVVAGWWWPAPGLRAVPAVEVDVAAGAVELVCPGPPRLSTQEEDFAYDPAFDPMPAGLESSATLVGLGREEAAAPPARWAPRLGAAAGGEDGGVPLAPDGAASSSAVVGELEGPSLLAAEPVDGVAALAAGATLARADAGDLRGLTAARCTPATTSAWLVAGSTELGASARLVLDNPGPTAATVTLEVWGATGPIDPGQAGTVLVPAGSERVVLLESFAAQEPRLAVHLTSAGGAVAPFVQDSELSGFVPTGVDLAAPVAEPDTHVVVPGVALDADGDDAAAPVLRVVNPGEEPATLALRLLGADGAVAVPGAEARVIDAGTVADVSLAGLPAGGYAAELRSDRPVTAAAMLTRVGDASPDDPDQPLIDRAWVAAAAESDSLLLPLPGIGDLADRATAFVTNPGTEPVDLRVRAVLPDGEVGEAETLALDAESTVVLDGDRWPGALALAVEVLADEVVGDEVLGDEAAVIAGVIGGVIGAVVVVADAEDGPLVAAVDAQEDLAQSRTVAVRLPGR